MTPGVLVAPAVVSQVEGKGAAWGMAETARAAMERVVGRAAATDSAGAVARAETEEEASRKSVRCTRRLEAEG